ncbi:MAG: universal stress protein, partial [Metallosphaera sp.]
MFKHILVAYDGSENAKRALNVAIDLTKRYEA